jgi:hypothetical protein
LPVELGRDDGQGPRGDLCSFLWRQPEDAQHSRGVVLCGLLVRAALQDCADDGEQRAAGSDERCGGVVDVEATGLDAAIEVACGVGAEGG